MRGLSRFIIILFVALSIFRPLHAQNRCSDYLSSTFQDLSKVEQAVKNIRKQASLRLGSARLNTSIDAFAPLLEKTFATQFPKTYIKQKSARANELSRTIHASLLLHFERLQKLGWPYRETHNFFYLVIQYIQTKYSDNTSDNLQRIFELLQSKSLVKVDQVIDTDGYLMACVNYFPKYIILPVPGLSDVAEMNRLAVLGVHVATFTNKIANIDGNNLEEPMPAYGHDFGHFVSMSKKSDLIFWQKIVNKIDQQKNRNIRLALHALLFHEWHEATNPVNKSNLRYFLNPGDPSYDTVRSYYPGVTAAWSSVEQFEKAILQAWNKML